MIQRLNDLGSLIIKSLIIIIAATVIFYFGISVYGNIILGRVVADNGLPVYPSISKAQYEITLTTTGEKLLAKEYENTKEGIYVLNGYYSLKGGTWRWTDRALSLDTSYFGEIKIERRVK